MLANATRVHGPALLEFLDAGVTYAFPADAGAESRGVPTAHATGVLGEGFSTTESRVWPSVEGRVRGASVVPHYDGAAATAARNPALYEALALVDAVRLGHARERTRAHACKGTAARVDHGGISAVWNSGVTDIQRSPNRDRLLRTARLLRPMLGELVFVGGQVAELLVTDPAAVRVRPTADVDVVLPVTTRTAYHALRQRLMALGFTPDTHAGAPVCRMRTHVSAACGLGKTSSST